MKLFLAFAIAVITVRAKVSRIESQPGIKTAASIIQATHHQGWPKKTNIDGDRPDPKDPGPKGGTPRMAPSAPKPPGPAKSEYD